MARAATITAVPVAEYKQAMAHFETNELDQAAAILRQITDKHPRYFEGWHLLGVVALETGAYAEAQNFLEHAVALRPEAEIAVNNLAAAYSKLERYEDAEAAYRAALQLRPFYPQVHSNLGGTLVQLGRFEEARNSFITAIAMNNRFGEPYQTLAYNHKFTRADGIGKMLQRAEEELEQFPPSDRI